MVVREYSSPEQLVHVGAVSSGQRALIVEASGRIGIIENNGKRAFSTVDARGPRILAADYSDASRKNAIGTIEGVVECLEVEAVGEFQTPFSTRR